jgi:hypothetical protein
VPSRDIETAVAFLEWLRDRGGVRAEVTTLAGNVDVNGGADDGDVDGDDR